MPVRDDVLGGVRGADQDRGLHVPSVVTALAELLPELGHPVRVVGRCPRILVISPDVLGGDVDRAFPFRFKHPVDLGGREVLGELRIHFRACRGHGGERGPVRVGFGDPRHQPERFSET